MAKYQHAFDPDTSYGSAVRLLESADLAAGLVLDVGCGYGAVAEVLTSNGFTYVGVDIDRQAIDDLVARGVEAHQVGLLVPEAELTTTLAAIVGGRPLVAILALDVLEHLLDVPSTLRALGALAAPTDAQLIVSYPNVTHYDVAAKLLMGRWDTTDEGLLDRTHTQFLSGHRLDDVFAATGWHQVDASDVVREVSDQCFPSYTPVLRPGTPARELLRRWRDDADPFGETFQFVRRFELGEPRPAAVEVIDEERLFASVVVVADASHEGSDAFDHLLADIDAQSVPAGEVAVVSLGDDETGGDDLTEAINRILRAATGRYVLVVRPGERLSSQWLAAFAAAEPHSPGQVLRCQTVGFDPSLLRETGGHPDEVLGAAPTLEAAILDPLHAGRTRPPVWAAFAVPAEVAQSAGLRLDPVDGDASFDVWLARAALLCGVQPVDAATVGLPADEVSSGGELDARIDEALDRDPMVLPAGSASRLAGLRHRVIALDEELARSNADRAARQDELDTLIRHLAEVGGRNDVLQAERDHWRAVAERKPSVQIRALLSRLATKLGS